MVMKMHVLQRALRRAFRPDRLASNDISGFAALGAIIFAMAAAFIVAGLIAIYFVKRYARNWCREGGIITLIANVVGASAAMYVGSMVSWYFLNNRLGRSYQEKVQSHVPPWGDFALSGAKFACAVVLSVIGALIVEKLAREKGFQRFAESIGVVVMAIVFSAWHLLATPWVFLSDPIGAIRACYESFIFSFEALVQFSFGGDPIGYVALVVQHHNGNQFELAEYYPAMLILLLALSGLASFVQIGQGNSD